MEHNRIEIRTGTGKLKHNRNHRSRNRLRPGARHRLGKTRRG